MMFVQIGTHIAHAALILAIAAVADIELLILLSLLPVYSPIPGVNGTFLIEKSSIPRPKQMV